MKKVLVCLIRSIIYNCNAVLVVKNIPGIPLAFLRDFLYNLSTFSYLYFSLLLAFIGYRYKAQKHHHNLLGHVFCLCLAKR